MKKIKLDEWKRRLTSKLGFQKARRKNLILIIGIGLIVLVTAAKFGRSYIERQFFSDEATYLLLHCYVADYSDAASTAAFPGQYVDDIEVRVTTGNRYGIGRTPDLP